MLLNLEHRLQRFRPGKSISVRNRIIANPNPERKMKNADTTLSIPIGFVVALSQSIDEEGRGE